jgi:hypothetical protein
LAGRVQQEISSRKRSSHQGTKSREVAYRVHAVARIFIVSGVAVIVALLKASTPVTNIVPAAKIMAGDVPINTVLPAIAVTQISGIPRNTIRVNELPKMHTDRVQVSVLFKGAKDAPSGIAYPSAYNNVKAMMKLVLAACPNQRATINSVVVDSIVPDQEGPDLYDDATALYSQSRDFFVRWLQMPYLITEDGSILATEDGKELTV